MHPHTTRHPSPNIRPSGFTLIELLTVIAIVGILAAIIIPVVGKARKSARNAQCISNLRQCASVLLGYATDNRNKISMRSNGSGPSRNVWSIMIADYMGIKATESRNPALDFLYCPSYPPYRHDPQNTTSWVWNVYGGFFIPNEYGQKEIVKTDGNNFAAYTVNLNTLRDPSRMPLLMDSVRESSGSQWMSIREYAPSTTDGSVHLRHNGRANTVFWDGHVKALGPRDLKDMGFKTAVNEDMKTQNL